MLPQFLFISNGGGVKPTHRRCFFLVYPPRMRGIFPPCGVDKRGRRETHTPPWFLFVYPKRRRCETHTLPSFPSFTPLSWGGISPPSVDEQGAVNNPRNRTRQRATHMPSHSFQLLLTQSPYDHETEQDDVETHMSSRLTFLLTNTLENKQGSGNSTCCLISSYE